MAQLRNSNDNIPLRFAAYMRAQYSYDNDANAVVTVARSTEGASGTIRLVIIDHAPMALAQMVVKLPYCYYLS